MGELLLLDAMKYSFADLVDIMKRLRAPNGCPWDREQDTRSLLPYLIEESSEFIDAAQAGDKPHMCEELGDVLLQVVFHAEVAREQGDFTIDDVVNSVSEKMVRRHPHVFGNASVSGSGEVLVQWEKIKANEKNNIALKGKSAMDKVARSLPSVARAQEMSRRAAKEGFDWKSDPPVFEKVKEEYGEFLAEYNKASKENPNKDRMEEEFGDLLFALASLARHAGINADTALTRACSKFDGRFRKVEMLANEKFPGKELKALSEGDLIALWKQAKTEKREGLS